jgi:hypothetical protein
MYWLLSNDISGWGVLFPQQNGNMHGIINIFYISKN